MGTDSKQHLKNQYKMKVLILSTLLVVSSSRRIPRAGDHHGDGHDDDMVCQPRANPVCSHSAEVQCKTVELEDCTDIIIPSCFNADFKVPYQEYDHRLRCSVGH